MKLEFVIGHGSFKSLPTTEELPRFVVVTGANGAGKTQFLQALNDHAMHGDWTPVADPVLLLTSAQLGSPTLTSSQGNSRRHMIDQLRAHTNEVMRPQGKFRPAGVTELYDLLHRVLGLTQQALAPAEQQAGKPISEWSYTDFELFAPFTIGEGLFDWSLSDTFERYNSMKTANDFNAWQQSQGRSYDPWLSDDEFVRLYGPPPWELVNDMLHSVGLPYVFPAPAFDLLVPSYSPRLVSTNEGIEVSPSELSSGESTLLQIALTIYSGLHRSETSRVPKVLLLDEPDATLHPSMTRSMLRLLEDVLVNRLNMRVFITTHSPTTVALAPETSLYLMERSGEHRLQKVTREIALSRLLVGVPTVHVSTEHRRVVFTESPKDRLRYARVFDLLRADFDTERSLEFVAAGGDGLADGRAAVVGLVRKLRDNGNTGVWGLVDRDAHLTEPHTAVFHNAERYTIENIVLDPLSLALLLLLEGDAPLRSATTATFVSFDTCAAQEVIDHVIARVLPAEHHEPRREVTYRNGATVLIPERWLDAPGHGLMDDVLAQYPRLKGHEKRTGLLEHVINTVWAQHPDWIPQSVERTFQRLLDD